MALDRAKLEVALTRAAELDAVAESHTAFDDEQISRVGAELGISPGSISRALSELNAGQTLTVETSAILPGELDTVTSDLATYLRLRGLVSVGAGVWEQRTGWWPDLYRFMALTPVAVTANRSGQSTHVTLTAGLDRIWRVHLLAGVFGFLAAALWTIPTLALMTILSGALMATLAMAVSWWFFIYRRRLIAWRLQWALEEIARPSYHIQPW